MLFKRIKDWATSITAFRTGDVIPVDGPDGTAKIGKDDLLRETAENAVSSGVGSGTLASPKQVSNSLELVFEDVITNYSFTSGSLKDDGTIAPSTYGYTNVSEYILLHEGDAVQYELRTSNTTQMILAVYDTDGSFISAIAGLGENRTLPLFGTFKATQECLIRFTIGTTGEEQYIFLKRASSKSINDNACDVPAVKASVSGRSVVSSTWVIGSVSHTTGAEAVTDKRIRSDYIPVKKGDVFAFDHSFGQIVYFDLLKVHKGALFPAGISQMPDTFTADFDGFIRIVMSFDITNGVSIVVSNSEITLLANRAYRVLPQDCYEEPARKAFDSEIDDKMFALTRRDGVKIGFITDLHISDTDVLTSLMSGNTSNIGRYYAFTKVPSYIDALVSIGNKTRCDMIVCGGDLIWGTISPQDSAKLLNKESESFEKFRGEYALLAGNHDFCDDYYASLDTPTDDDYYKPFELANLYRQKQLYGYKDLDGVRAFFLNSSDCFILEGGVKKYSRKNTFAFSQEQLDWFAQELANTPHGYHVVIFVHFAPRSASAVNYTNGSVIGSLLRHFVKKEQGTKTAGSGDFAVSVAYDFTMCDGNAIIGIVSGHSHEDKLYVDEDGITNIVTTTASMFDLGGLIRTYNTPTETAFDIICIDKENFSVHIERFGAGSDRDFTY